MNANRCLLALLLLPPLAATADAQFVPNYGPPDTYGVGFRFSPRGRGAFSFSGGFYRGGYFGPTFFPPPPLFGFSSTRITIITVAPPPPPPFVPPLFFEGPPPELLFRPPPRMPEAVPDPPRPPEKPAPKPPEKEKDKDKAKEKKVEPKKDAPKRPAPPPDLDPFSRLMRQGKELFAEQQYGRAAARFRDAGRLEPRQALPQFLLAQALLQQGNYLGARDAVVAGLASAPDWPAGRFRPHELYADAEEYAALLLTLQRVQGRLPDDPALALLRGHVLWFDGQREQAAVLLRRARGGPDREAVERFLAALGDEAPL